MEITLEQKQKLQQLILPFKTGAVPLLDGMSTRGGTAYAGRISFLQALCNPQLSFPVLAKLLIDAKSPHFITHSEKTQKVLVGDWDGTRLVIGLERPPNPKRYICANFAYYEDFPPCAISLDTCIEAHYSLVSLLLFATSFNMRDIKLGSGPFNLYEIAPESKPPISGGKISIELGKRKIDVFGESEAYHFIENQNAKVQTALTEFFNAIGWDDILEFAKSRD